MQEITDGSCVAPSQKKLTKNLEKNGATTKSVRDERWKANESEMMRRPHCGHHENNFIHYWIIVALTLSSCIGYTHATDYDVKTDGKSRSTFS